MPKEKKRGAATGSASKHAPLGQVIADDANRSKYATVRSRQKEESEKSIKYQEGDLLDEKSTKKIFELSKEQMLEIEMDEQKQMELKRRKAVGARGGADGDSSDEEDNGSTMGDILDDEDEE
jgi:recombination DNA repair RAD52 pathway protein